MLDGVDTIVLFDELAYEDELPLRWLPQPGGVDAGLAAGFAERNVRVLQACAAVEESGVLEKTEETASIAAELLRIESKLNLLLDLVGQILIANHPRPPATRVRFNAHGALWRGAAPLPQPGTHGVVEIHLRECVAEPLRFAGQVVSSSAAEEVTVQFAPLGETVTDLIEKLAFRSHRRRIADSRHPRRAS